MQHSYMQTQDMQILTLLVEMMQRPEDVKMVHGQKRHRNHILDINYIPLKILIMI